jgi:hypothetical protein
MAEAAEYMALLDFLNGLLVGPSVLVVVAGIITTGCWAIKKWDLA